MASVINFRCSDSQVNGIFSKFSDLKIGLLEVVIVMLKDGLGSV